MINLVIFVVGLGNPQWLTRMSEIQVLFFYGSHHPGEYLGWTGSSPICQLDDAGRHDPFVVLEPVIGSLLAENKIIAWLLVAGLLGAGASLFIAAQIEESSLWGILIIIIHMEPETYSLVLCLVERQVIHRYGL